MSLNRFFVSESFPSSHLRRGMHSEMSRLNRFFVNESFPSLKTLDIDEAKFWPQSLLRQRIPSHRVMEHLGLRYFGRLNRFFISESLPTRQRRNIPRLQNKSQSLLHQRTRSPRLSKISVCRSQISIASSAANPSDTAISEPDWVDKQALNRFLASESFRRRLASNACETVGPSHVSNRFLPANPRRLTRWRG